MRPSEQVERYLSLFRLRLKQLTASRGAAIMSLTAIAVTVIAVMAAIRTGFPDAIVISSRFLLFGSLAALLWFFVVVPNRRIESDASSDIELRTPEFAGRIETYVGLKDRKNPMRELLAEDTLAIAAQHPPEKQVAQWEFTRTLGIASIAIIALLYLAIAGPGNLAYGVRHLWAGWAIPGLLPPQSIEVTPGDDGIRMGGTVRVRATMEGFAPPDATVHASFGDGDWQQVEMAEVDGTFEFTFFSVREPLQYYVSAASVRSQTYQVRVVDVPVMESLITTYNFPEWTGREPETRDPGGDVRAIADTEVVLDLTSDRPMSEAALIIDDSIVPVQIDGAAGQAMFSVEQDGQYFIAAIVGGEQIRLTDDYFITVLSDEGPKIEFQRPGRDWSASRIEEVTATISAEDDYMIESLELRYSVNGGEWNSVPLEAGADVTEIDHVFFLESISGDDMTDSPLVPGDLISYYAIASDRENSARTDIFFVDVQPFDKRYSQSQQAGGGGGGQGGDQQSEISQRQKEIIVSTWNLIREQQEQKRPDNAYVPDNAALLSRLQSTLRDQALTLAERTRARELTATDEKIAEFVDHLDKAANAMVPAAGRLAEIELEQAILPEQEALQHLLRAEAVFTDISVSIQANSRGGGGGRAGRDLSEMFEIEMDLEKNQYESGSNATPDAPDQQLDEIGNELEELARRQEQLAQNTNRTQTPTTAQRWQQEMLRREVEELRERLERMQQEQANQQANNQSSQQSGSQSQQSSQGSESQSEQQSGQQSEQSQQQSDLQRRLESAVRAMNEADQAMREGADQESLQRATAEAQRQLEGARDRIAEEQVAATQAAVKDLAERAEDLYDRQTDLEGQLQDAIRDVNVGTNEFDRLDSGMSISEEYEMAEAKRQLQKELQTLEQDAKSTAQRIAQNEPDASEQIDDAIDKLRNAEVEARLAVSAAYIEQGEAVYVAGSESAITDALRELQDDLQQAETMAGEQGSDRGTGQGGLSRALAETRQLRRGLQGLAEPGTNNNTATNRGRDDLQQSTGIRVGDLESPQDIEREIASVSDDVLNMFRELRDAGVSPEDIDEIRRLATQIRASDFSGNEEILERESQAALSLVEQLELILASVAGDQADSVRSTAVDDIPDNHKETVADYYRRLGESATTVQNP